MERTHACTYRDSHVKTDMLAHRQTEKQRMQDQCSRCAYPDLILSTLAGQGGFVTQASQPQMAPILVGRNIRVCPALCIMPQTLPFFPALLQKHLAANVGVMQLKRQPVPGVGGWAQLQ